MSLKSAETPMSEGAAGQYVRTQEYSSMLPMRRLSQRPVQYPFNEALENIEIPVYPDLEDEEFGNRELLVKMNLSFSVRMIGIGDWRFEMRRDAQEILPFLYLGPIMCVKNREFLQNENFSLFVSVRTSPGARTWSASAKRTANEWGIAFEPVDVVTSHELLYKLPDVIRDINDHICVPRISENGEHLPKKVLVLCESGNESSAIVVAAYLMAMFDLDIPTALQLVQNRRFSISHESPFWSALSSFGGILKAKRDVQKANRAMTSASAGLPAAAMPSKKRNLNDLEDDEMIDDAGDIGDDEPDRRPLAPFQDS